MINLNYDKTYDVLYIGFLDRSNSVGDESDDGDVIFRDRLTHEITGVTIFDFKEKLTEGRLPSLPYAYDYCRDVVPLV